MGNWDECILKYICVHVRIGSDGRGRTSDGCTPEFLLFLFFVFVFLF